MTGLRLLIIGFLLFLISSCKNKDISPPDTFVSFEIKDSESQVVINDRTLEISIVLGANTKWSEVKIGFSTTNNSSVKLNGFTVESGDVIDLSSASDLTVVSKNGVNNIYTLVKSSVFEKYGMGSLLSAGRSAERSYSYYLDQFNTGTYQYINCGPTVATMAIRWSDSTFSGTVLDARNTFRSQGGWWYTNDIHAYLRQHNIAPQYASLSNNLSQAQYEFTLKEQIDAGYLTILCLDMYYVKENPDPEQRTNRFYNARTVDWGHFVLVKGYKVVDGKMWLEIHDPYSLGIKYSTYGELKGKNRYYDPVEIKKATDVWWPYSILVPKKGTSINARFKTTSVEEALITPQKGRGF